MRPLERVRGVIAGTPVDHLPAQPMVMMFAARHAGALYIDYTKDPRTMAGCQLKMVRDFGIDCVLMCSDPAREVIDIAGDDSVKWFVDQGPVINEERAALLEKARLNEFKVPDPHRQGRMHDRVRAIEICLEELRGETSIVGWVEGPLALAQELRGLTRIMTDVVDDPGFVRDLMDFTSEVAIVYAAAQIEAGADTIGMSDAAASMIGPRHYRDLVLPWQRRVLQSVRDAHPEVILRQHMCGNVDALIPQMATLPVDIYELDFPTNLVAARAALGPTGWSWGTFPRLRACSRGRPRTSSRRAPNVMGPAGGTTSSVPGVSCRPSRHQKTFMPWSASPPSTRPGPSLSRRRHDAGPCPCRPPGQRGFSRGVAPRSAVGAHQLAGVHRHLHHGAHHHPQDTSRPRPGHNVSVGGVHLHHYLWGILTISTVGGVALRGEDRLRRHPVVAIAYGAGLALIVDEFALLLDLQDVYWAKQGRQSVDLAIGMISTSGTVLMAMPVLRRLRHNGKVIPPAA